MFNQISKLFKSSTVVAVMLLSGCGGGHPTVADGGTVSINPASVTANISGLGGACNGAEWSYSEFVITVYNTNNIPVSNVGLSVTLDWTSGTDTGAPVMILYDDPTWVSGSSTPPTNAVGGSYSTNTGSDGTKRLIVGSDLSCTFKGNLNVYTGALYQQATITITSN